MVLGTGATGGIALLLLRGLAYGVSVSLQIWMIQAAPAPRAVEAATALWVSAFHLAIGLGALRGGRVVDGTALAGVRWLAAALFLAAAVVARFAGRRAS